MADLDGYQQWLAKQQRQPSFINNHWCLMLAHEMEANKLLEGFNIPYFIVEEQLTKEDDNVNLENKDDAYISPALRHWLVELLKSFSAEATILNYEEILRDFLEKENILPIGIARPLTPSTSFHNLPSECKLWIFCALRAHKSGKPSKPPLTVSKDPLGNAYHIISDGLLYVRLAKTDNCALPIDEGKLKDQAWASLYRFVHQQPCKLLCDSQDSWEVVWKAFLSFKLNNLYQYIRPEMTVKLCARNSIMMMREGHRTDFENVLTRMTPIPSARKLNKMNNESEGNFDPNALQTTLEILDMNGSHSQAPVARPKPRKKQERCRQFPQCQLFPQCPHVHPKIKCTKFPNCSYGWQCLFLHEFCPNDAYCEEPNCPYEHVASQTTYYRLPRGPDAENPIPIASVSPLTRKMSNQSLQGAPEDLSTAPVPPSNNQDSSQTKRRRCQYFPQCKSGDACGFVHPEIGCRNFPAGKPCPGQWCLFKHGPCPNDGTCRDMKCAYEHWKSKPVVMRKQASKKRQGVLSRAPSTSNLSRATSQSNLSRATSQSNLSTCSGRSRKKSVSFENDSEYESCEEKEKDSTNQPPPGILRSTDRSVDPCRFGSSCTRKTSCRYTHPTEKCPAFPQCPNGGICKYLHETCQNDGVCSKVNCDYAHKLPHEVGNSWCKNGSRCARVGCRFIHPEECIPPCSTPGGCWKYHRPAARRPPGGPPILNFGPGPGFPGAPGFMPPPFAPPPPGVRYGFGPDFTYRSPAPGYGPGPGMGPGFPSAGFGPMNPPDPSDYRPRPHHGPPGPPPPRTPRPSPPPAYSNFDDLD